MAIRIKRNNEGNCINFEGSSNPTYWNACLSGEVDSELPDTVNIINDIQTARTGEVQYEFFRIPYTEFEDRDGNTFDTAADVAAYITDQANVVGLNTTGLDLTNTSVGFRLDDTSTSIILDNGFSFGINTIKAIPDNDGTIHIHAIGSDLPSGVGEASPKKHFEKLDHTRITIEGAPVSGGLNDVANTLNELFTAGPFAAVVVSDPYATLIPNLTGENTTGTLLGNAIDPSGPNIAARGPGTSPRYNDSGWLSDDTINGGGEYFTVNMIMPNNPNATYFFGMGLVNALSSQTIGDSYAGDPDNFANDSAGNNVNYGFQWSNWWHTSPNGPLAVYGADSGYIEGPGWSSFPSSDEGVGFEAGSPVTVKVGIDFNGFIEIGYYDQSAGSFVQIARSDYPVPEGNEYRLGVKFAYEDGVNIFDTPKVHLVDEADPTMYFRTIESPDGLWHYPIFATEEEANFYDLNHDGTTGSGTSHTHVFPDDPTNTVWYMPDTGATMNATERPQISPGTFQGVEIQYTEITSLVNQDLKPPAFTDSTVTVNELASVNIAINPADHSWTTAVTDNESSGLVLDGSNLHLIGTSPEVTSDNVSNPNDVYTFTISRSNNYGTSTGTLTVIVNNLTAPVYSAITGFTHLSGSTALAGASAMDSGSVVEVDETLDDEQRFVILQSYVEENILPSLQTAGDKYYIGMLNTGTDVSSISASDFDLAFVWEYDTISSHTYSVIQDGTVLHTSTIGSAIDSYYDYAIEVIGSTAWMIGCNVNAINTEPSPTYGGSFSNATSAAYGESLPLELVMSYTGSDTANFSLSGLSKIVTPAPSSWVQVTSNGSNVISFDGSSSLSLQAGNTYRFLMDDIVYADQTTATLLSSNDVLRFTADGSTEYTTGITRVGTPGVDGSYVEFVVPSDVPPLQWYTDFSGIGAATGVTISGSTYVTPVSGITLEGPIINQTGSNLFNDPVDDADGVVWGWLSIDQQLGAGERLVLDNAFLVDLTDEMPNNSGIFIGLKSNSWSENYRNNSIANATFAGARFAIYKYSAVDIRVFGYITGGSTIGRNIGTSGVTNTGLELAFEITNSGNNIRMMMRSTGTGYNSSDDVTSTAYADWNSSYKTQTGDQGYGLTSLDVMILGDGNVSSTAADDEFDTANVDWTGLSEISVPTPAATLTTNWTKALDFSGSSERTQQVSSSTNHAPLRMAGINNNVPGNTTSGYTASDTNARPWATAIVYSSDNNASNQHIWNFGEGAGSTDDNIYLRTDAYRGLWFGWGRSGAINECYLGSGSSTAGTWYGVYIASTGERLGGGHTAAEIAACFDIRNVNLQTGAAGTNRSTAANWSHAGSGSYGHRMNREFTGDMTIGGRGSNRNFHGKVASMVVTTLQRNVAMPTDAEISMMVRDPVQWLTDYKVGKNYRLPINSADSSNFTLGTYDSMYATQVWLMGDSPGDAYSQIRNYVWAANQNYTAMNMISMVSNDIENVSINGLS